MYIRRTQTHNTMTGEQYCTHHLVKSERIGGKVKQNTLLNLGRHFAVEQAEWPSLCARIEELLNGQAALVPVLEREAQWIVAQLLVRQRVDTQTEEKLTVDIQPVDVASLETINPRTVSVESLGLWAMQQINFAELLESMGLNASLCSAAITSIIGHMAAPASEHATYV